MQRKETPTAETKDLPVPQKTGSCKDPPFLSQLNYSYSWTELLLDIWTHVSGKDTVFQNYISYHLRTDQLLSEISERRAKQDVTLIVAPIWVHEGMDRLWKNVTATHLRVYERRPALKWFNYLRIPIAILPNLTRLQLLSRNQMSNVNGDIRMDLYHPGIADPNIVLSLKDLARQTVIVAEEETSNFGGYRFPLTKQTAKVFICDLSALQFQNKCNTGRLVLLGEGNLERGLLDEFIYRHVVGESQMAYSEALKISERYKPCKSRIFGNVLFDTVAYKKFVANDVCIAAKALLLHPDHRTDNIVFKFLKYGTGYFAGEFEHVIEKHILDGVLDGLEQLFGSDKSEKNPIKGVHLPFFVCNSTNETRVKDIESNYGVSIQFAAVDALQSSSEGSVICTTNCGDSHAVFGNEMRHQSVDAAIAQNLKGKGYNLCPLMASVIKEVFI